MDVELQEETSEICVIFTDIFINYQKFKFKDKKSGYPLGLDNHFVNKLKRSLRPFFSG